MKVLFDNTIFTLQNFGGISRYFSELLSFDSGFKPLLPIITSNNIYLNKIHNIDYLKQVYKLNDNSKIINRLKRKFLPHLVVEQATNRSLMFDSICTGDFDVFHPTYYDPYFMDSLGSKPFVLTVYDMIHEIYPEYFSLTDTTRFNKLKLISNASHIIAISNSTKSDIKSIYGVPDEKISVIYLATDLNPLEACNSKRLIKDEYILFTGVRTGYKNFYFFLATCSEFLHKYKDIKLVCTGSPFSIEEIEFIKSLDLTDSVVHLFATDFQLANLYTNALVFVFPSLYEGFGLPILEAFACSCPTIISNTSSMPEVGGDAALYISPKSNSDIIQALESVIFNQDFSNLMRAKGLAVNKLFSWSKTCEKTYDVYRKLL